MIYRSKAPLRIGLAGGGTDVSPYCDLYGGAILNATVSLYAYANIEPLQENAIILQAVDRKEEQRFEWNTTLPTDGKLDLLKGVYNRIHRDYGIPLSGFRLSTSVDAPAGSGLGTSSTLVVAIIGAFAEMLRLPLGEYDIAHLAYEIERHDLKMAGGRQDQYAATFGGVNFMEFFGEDKVIVNPLRIRQQYLFELENNLLLYYTDTSRESAKIIERQSKNVLDKQEKSIEASIKAPGPNDEGTLAQRPAARNWRDPGFWLPAKAPDGRRYFKQPHGRVVRHCQESGRYRRQDLRRRRRRLHDLLLSRQYQIQRNECAGKIRRPMQAIPICRSWIDELDDHGLR
jgi:galactokinase/mevalonate kinase-like predicted kinase